MKAPGLAYSLHVTKRTLINKHHISQVKGIRFPKGHIDLQIPYLFLCNFIIFFTGHGLLPLLPLYASDFGASPTVAGFYLAFIYLAITVGALLSGRMARRLGHKRLFLLAGLAGIPALILLGQATTLWQVILLTAVIWFSGGVGSAMVSVFTGLAAKKESRGKSFGLMFLAWPLGAMISGMTVGSLVEWRGYPTMFTAVSLLWLLWPILGLFLLQLNKMPNPASGKSSKATFRFNRPFALLLLAMLSSGTAMYISRLGISLTMQTLNFAPAAISSTTAAGGLVAIPVTILLGMLSDKLGRGRFLTISFSLAVVGSLILIGAAELWHFLLAAVFFVVAKSGSGAVAAARATDLLEPDMLSTSLPWLNSMTWIAGIIGFATAGAMLEALGPTVVYLIAAGLSALPLLLLYLAGYGRGRLSATTPQPASC